MSVPFELSVLMPAFNEEQTISTAVSRVLDLELDCPVQLIVVDDGSTDNTAEVLAAIDDRRLVVHRHSSNLGKGAAVLTAAALATGTHLLIFDADLEYSAHDIPKLIAPIVHGDAHVVYGSRVLGKSSSGGYRPFRYVLGNRLTTFVADTLYHGHLSDLHTCLKLIPVALFRDLKLTEHGFGLDSEITAEILRRRVQPAEVGVSYFGRSHAEGKKIKWTDGVRCLIVLTRVRARGRAAAWEPDGKVADKLPRCSPG